MMGMNRTDDDVNGKDDEAYCQISSVITAEVAHRFYRSHGLKNTASAKCNIVILVRIKY